MTSLKAKLALAGTFLLLVVALATAFWRLAQVSAELTSTTAQVSTLSSQLDALQARQRALSGAVQTLQNHRIKTDEQLREALSKEPDWAAAATPAAVVDGVCQFARCGR